MLWKAIHQLNILQNCRGQHFGTSNLQALNLHITWVIHGNSYVKFNLNLAEFKELWLIHETTYVKGEENT